MKRRINGNEDMEGTKDMQAGRKKKTAKAIKK